MIRFIHLFDMVRTAHPTTQIIRRVRHAHQQPTASPRRVRRAHQQPTASPRRVHHAHQQPTASPCRVRHAHQQPTASPCRVLRAHQLSIQKTTGFSYMEVLVATALIAITLVPAMEALSPGIQGSALHKQRTETHYALQGKMEEVLAESFEDLDNAATAAGAHTAATSYTDVFSPTITRDVYIWRYDVDDADADGNVFTGGESDLLWVRVALPDDSLSIETLISHY